MNVEQSGYCDIFHDLVRNRRFSGWTGINHEIIAEYSIIRS